MARIFNRIKYTKYILMFGACAREWVRFASSLCSIYFTVMVYDASYTRELFLTTASKPEDTKVRLRDKVFTTDLEYMLEDGSGYDLVLIYDDFSQQDNYARYEHLLDYGYICCSSNMYSIIKMTQLCDTYTKNPHYPFMFVFDGDEDEARKWQVLEHWKYLTTRRRQSEGQMFIPRCESDYDSYLQLEFGRLCYGELSQPLQEFLFDVEKRVAGNIPITIQVEPILGV